MSGSAFLLAGSGIALLSIMDAIIKALAARYPILEVTFLRFAAGLCVASVVLFASRPRRPSRETVIANSGRALLAVLTSTTFFFALKELPLAEALTLSFMSPLFVAGFGVVLLGERAGPRLLAALGAGFAGVLVVVWDQLGAGERERSLAGIVSAVVSAVAYALALVLLRARARRDPIPLIVWFQNAGPAVILAPFAVAAWQTPSLTDLGLFACLGLLGVPGHLLLASAYARAEAARLASLDYTSLIWGAILGYTVFSEVPSVATFVGAGLIIAGTLAASRRHEPGGADRAGTA